MSGPDQTSGPDRGVYRSLDSYAKDTSMYVSDISQKHQTGAEWLADAAAEPTAPGLGDRERPYRAVFWRGYLGTRAYGVYDALAAAAGAGLDGRAAALAGFGDGRAMVAALARLEAESLVWTHRDGRLWVFDVLRALPALSPAQTGRLPRALRNGHLDFLGMTPGFDLPAWWRRKEPSFAPYAVRAFGLVRIGGNPE